MGWWGLWQTEGYMPCLKDCLKFVADVEMLASVARCLIFFFRCQRCVCLCKVSKLFNVGHQITLKTPVWTDQNICR